MKAFSTLLIILIAQTSFAKSVQCTLNLKGSQAVVSAEQNKHPHTKRQQGDDGAILVADLDEVSFEMADEQIVSGKIKAGFLQGESTEFNKDGLVQNTDFDLETAVQTDAIKNLIKLKLLFTGWDHYHYYIKINQETGTAYLSGDFDYDCGGSGSTVYAVYDCSVKN